MGSSRRISKSAFLQGLQCRKLLWHRYHAKELFPPVGALQQAIFDQGHEGGALAKTLFPGGIEVAPGVTEFEAVCAETARCLPQRRPLFEAAFQTGDGYARVDILEPVGADEWNLVEVKSSTGCKDVHLQDIAFQASVATAAGLRLRRCFLLHINSAYRRAGAVDATQLFTRLDVTDAVQGMARDIEEQLAELLRAAGAGQSPEVPSGPHCLAPYACPLTGVCWKFLPPQNVMELYRDKKKGFNFLGRGIHRLADIPDEFKLSRAQQVQRACAKSGELHVEPAAVRQFLAELRYPLHFLDFETFGSAVPPFDHSQPFQQIPFQFSLHVIEAPGAAPQHTSFLAETTADPRPAFMAALQSAVGPEGSIVTYNAKFEKGILSGCAKALPESAAWVAGVKQRVADLLVPFQKFHCHHPAQAGSASIKAVLPAFTGRGYTDMAIGDGGTASLEFYRVTFTAVPDAERRRVRESLERYCELDTLAMVWLTDKLRELAA